MMITPPGRARRPGAVLRLVPSLLLLTVFSVLLPHPAIAQAPSEQGTTNLTLAAYLDRVLERNRSVQQKVLEMAAKDREARGEVGIFEPELYGEARHEEDKRQNTVQESVSAGGINLFQEHNNIYQGGIESLVPTGAKVRLGYSLRDLNNNLQTEPQYLYRGATNGEYQSFFGISVTQPLLKNGGVAATMAGIRLAALGSEQAFQEYRRELMLTVVTAEASYWNLYMAQEQVRLFEESVETAKKVLADSRSRLEAGKGSQLEVLEAESGLALRQSKLSDARQKLYDVMGRLLTLSGEVVREKPQLVYAVDRPKVKDVKPVFFEAWLSSYERNPDYLIQRQKVREETVRLGYARNQRLPDLSLKGSYGYNGLGDTPGSSWTDIQEGGFPAWNIGLELRIPLAGGIKPENQLAAARLRYRAAVVGLREIETQIANSLNTSLSKIDSARQSVNSYQTVVDFNQKLLASAMARLEVGRIESKRVLDIEADLFEAQNSLVDASVQYERAFLELGMLEGSVLRERHIDLTQPELVSQTDQLLHGGKFDEAEYRDFLRSMRQEYEYKQSLAALNDTASQAKARASLRKTTEPVTPWWATSWWATNSAYAPPDAGQERDLQDILRQEMKQSNGMSNPPAAH